jgi:uncharacterized protein YaeQ
MAIKSTIFKVTLSVADIDHAYYADHSLTLARHPSETDERMMMRLLALSFNAHLLNDLCQGDGQLVFGAGLSDPDEPDVWLKDFTGQTRLWVEVGQPEEKPLSRACSKSDKVVVYAYHHAAEVWWKGIQNKLTRMYKLSVYRVSSDISQELARWAERSMQIQAIIQDGHLMLSSHQGTIEVTCERWK